MTLACVLTGLAATLITPPWAVESAPAVQGSASVRLFLPYGFVDSAGGGCPDATASPSPRPGETAVPISAPCRPTDTPSPTPTDTPSPTPTAPATEPAGMIVRFFDVEQGDGAWIHTHDGFNVIVDAGGRRRGRGIAQHLRDHGVDRIDELHASHADADHIGGLIAIIEDFPVDLYVHNGEPHDTETFRDLATAVATRAIPTAIARDGIVRAWGCCVTAQFLHPVEPPYANQNDASIVMRVSHGSVDVLFTGDIELAAERQIVGRYKERPESIASEILKVPHHGSRSSSSEDFLALVSPRTAVISSGTAWGHPHEEVVERLLRFGIAILGTVCHGDIEIASYGDDYGIEPAPWLCWSRAFHGELRGR